MVAASPGFRLWPANRMSSWTAKNLVGGSREKGD